MLDLHNHLWVDVKFLKVCKESEPIPITKSGMDLQSLGSNRPISLLCCKGKVLETMVVYQLLHELEKLNLISI